MSKETVTVYVMSADQSREYASKNGGTSGHLRVRPLFAEIGKDAFFIEAEAVERAKAMAEAKLKSLRAQQSRVSKLMLDGFKIKDGKS